MPLKGELHWPLPRQGLVGEFQALQSGTSLGHRASFVLRWLPLPNPQPATLTYRVEPDDYIRDIDCREITEPNTVILSPEFVSALSIFKTVRFMKWQVATEGNWPVRWKHETSRVTAIMRKDGVPVELLVSAANEAGTDLWVTVPWNADDDYIIRFATYLRDHRGPSAGLRRAEQRGLERQLSGRPSGDDRGPSRTTAKRH